MVVRESVGTECSVEFLSAKATVKKIPQRVKVRKVEGSCSWSASVPFNLLHGQIQELFPMNYSRIVDQNSRCPELNSNREKVSLSLLQSGSLSRPDSKAEAPQQKDNLTSATTLAHTLSTSARFPTSH